MSNQGIIPPENLKCFFYKDAYSEGMFTNFVTSYTFNYIHFQKLIESKDYLFLGELRKFLKEIIGEYWDNNPFRFSNIYGTEFEFQISNNKDGNYIVIFSSTGDHNLGAYPIVPGVVKQILIAADDYTHGFCKCSLCQEKIKIIDITGSYFGGRYCKRCWEEGYKGRESMKTVEARESYN